jgi:hypothetical protein
MHWLWLGFIAFVLALLALDLGVFHRKAHVVSMREAFGWSAVWIGLGLTFSVFIYFAYDHHWLGLGTTDPFLVYTSNVFAILGLRSLYFALADLIDKFRYLKTSLSLILATVGLKMLFGGPLKEESGPHFMLYLLGLIVIILAFGVLASIYTGPGPSEQADAADGSRKRLAKT